jgi:hypothetical protein
MQDAWQSSRAQPTRREKQQASQQSGRAPDEAHHIPPQHQHNKARYRYYPSTNSSTDHPSSIIHGSWCWLCAAPRQCMMVGLFLSGCRHTHMMTDKTTIERACVYACVYVVQPPWPSSLLLRVTYILSWSSSGVVVVVGRIIIEPSIDPCMQHAWQSSRAHTTRDAKSTKHHSSRAGQAPAAESHQVQPSQHQNNNKACYN